MTENKPAEVNTRNSFSLIRNSAGAGASEEIVRRYLNVFFLRTWSVSSPRESQAQSQWSLQAGDVPQGKCGDLPPSLPPPRWPDWPLIQATQSECPPDSEAAPEGAVRGPGGSAGEKEQSLLQVFLLLSFVFVFLNSNSNTKFNENKFSIPFRRQRICESSTAFVIIVSFSGEPRSPN